MNLTFKEINREDKFEFLKIYKEYQKVVSEFKKNEDMKTFNNLNTIDFEQWIENLKYNKRLLYLAINEKEKVVGFVMVNMKNNLSYLPFESMIEYIVIPSERNKGYATEMLKFALRKLKKQKYKKVIVFCNKFNIASIKVIEKNAGEYEDSLINSKDGNTYIKYSFDLRKKYANRVKDYQNIIDVEQKIKHINSNDFCGDIYLNYYKNVITPVVLKNDICVCKNNYKWLGFYDYNSKVLLTAVYNEDNEIVEWYFDIAKELGKKYEIPYEYDLYLDVILKPNGDIFLLDEDELIEALQKNEISKEEYDEAYKTTRLLIDKIDGKTNEIRLFTDKYLKLII